MYNQYGIRRGNNQQIERQNPNNNMACETTNVNSMCNQIDSNPENCEFDLNKKILKTDLPICSLTKYRPKQNIESTNYLEIILKVG